MENQQKAIQERKKDKSITIVLAVISCIVLAILAFFIVSAALINQRKKQATLPMTGTDLSFLKVESGQQNMIYSPLAIKYGLALLRDTTAGETKKQIEKMLGDKDLPEYNDVKNVSTLVNALAIKDTLKEDISNDYAEQVAKQYHADIVYDNFSDGRTLDKWLNSKASTFMPGAGVYTNDKTQMVLINSLVMQAVWKDNFVFEHKSGEDFYPLDGREMKAEMMHQVTSSNAVSYHQNDKMKILKIDLEAGEGKDLEFVAFMPQEDLDQYIKMMIDSSLGEIQSLAKQTRKASELKHGVSIYLPSFHFDSGMNLRSDLESLGVMNVFYEDQADFSPLSQKKLFLDDAAHQANLDLANMNPGAPADETEQKQEQVPAAEVRFDRPFLILVQDKKTDDVWFVGTVYEPEMWSA